MRLIHGDALGALPELADASIDAVITDPPYELGFMGRAWDASGIAYSVDLWRHCLRVLKPGGHLLAFGGTRTSHRLAVAVEDAGFEIRDSIVWIYGSGFPKSLDVSKAIDKRPGVGRHAEFAVDLRAAMAAKGYTNTFDVAEAVVGRRTGAVANWQKYQFPEAKWWPRLRDLLGMSADWDAVIAEADRVKTGERTTGIGTGNGSTPIMGDNADRSRFDDPATDDAKRWAGWGTALKPAFEPIVVARKPLIGTVAANVLAHGTGALNIDACRVEHASEADLAVSLAKNPGRDDLVTSDTYGGDRPQQSVNTAGRWPANVVLDEVAAAELDEQSGERPGMGIRRTLNRGGTTSKGLGYKSDVAGSPAEAGYADTGGASRFFPVFRYQAKAPTRERPKVDGVAHPTVKPLDLMRWLVRLVTPPGGLVLDPFAGSGTTLEAAALEAMDGIGIEREASYLPLIVERMRRAGVELDAQSLAPALPLPRTPAEWLAHFGVNA